MNKKDFVGSLIGVIIIILVLGALYVFMKKEKPGDSWQDVNDTETFDQEALSIESELASEESSLDSLETELKTTNP